MGAKVAWLTVTEEELLAPRAILGWEIARWIKSISQAYELAALQAIGAPRNEAIAEAEQKVLALGESPLMSIKRKLDQATSGEPGETPTPGD